MRSGERGGEDERRGERGAVMTIMYIKKHKKSQQKSKNTTFSKKKKADCETLFSVLLHFLAKEKQFWA